GDMRRTMTARFLVTACVLACGKTDLYIGETTETGALDANVDDGVPDTFPGHFARAVCNSVDKCCAVNGYKLDHASCIATVMGYEQRQINKAIAVGMHVDDAGAARCLNVVRDVFSQCPTDKWWEASRRFHLACDFRAGSSLVPDADGKVAPGGTCTR